MNSNNSMRKKIKLSLVEVIAEALCANKFEAVFNVPGFGGSDVVESLIKKEKLKTFINLNEEAAFSISYGVSSNGKRAALLIKSQGFVKALNAITSSLSTETASANLVFIFDDTEGKSSDNIIPTKKIVKSTEMPYVILGKDPAKDISNAIVLSEKLKIPFAIIVDCKDLNNSYASKINVAKMKPAKISGFTERVACPILTKYQREKLKNKINGKSLKVTPPRISDIRKILPEKILSEFIKYEDFMNVFVKHRPSFVSGDAGTSALYAFNPFNCIDTCTYMGGSPGMAIGAMIAGKNDAVSVTGDFSFLAAGILGLNEAVLHTIPLKLIIFNNGKAHATGGQMINPSLMGSFRRGFSQSILDLKLLGAKESQIEKVLSTFLKRNSLSILILEI
jgi:TPP-dependent indolepyruvate ferredoxin oxidoreductase alpha subunit